MFLLNSRLGLLTAAPALPIALRAGASLLPKLRDYFAEFLNVVSLAHLGLLDPSTCVGLRYGPAGSNARAAFLGAMRQCVPPPEGGVRGRTPPPLPVGGASPKARRRVHSPAGRRNVRLPSIGYASRPGLRPRLTLGGRTCPRKPRICGGRDSHPPFRYSCLHGHPHALHAPSRERFGARAALSYQRTQRAFRGFGCPLQSRSFSARGLSASALLRDLQMVAASEPTSWLSSSPHILTIH